jgi:DNA polymerase III epsilon subunit-like protein
MCEDFREMRNGFPDLMVAKDDEVSFLEIKAEGDAVRRNWCFRFPKLCTCVGMRRRFPGHRSYSLGNLCDTYGIDLEDHRRALCDAEAHLLNLIVNEKRRPRRSCRTRHSHEMRFRHLSRNLNEPTALDGAARFAAAGPKDQISAPSGARQVCGDHIELTR